LTAPSSHCRLPSISLNKEPRHVSNPTLCRCLPICLQYRES
jgi:hypothetical protein